MLGITKIEEWAGDWSPRVIRWSLEFMNSMQTFPSSYLDLANEKLILSLLWDRNPARQRSVDI